MQPDNNSGLSALELAAQKGERRTRAVPTPKKPKAPKEPVAEEPASPGGADTGPAPEEAPEKAAEAPPKSKGNPTPGEGTKTRESAPQRQEEPQEEPSASGGADERSREATVIPAAPQPAIPMDRLVRNGPGMDPTQFRMISGDLTRLLKSLRNIADNLIMRQGEYEQTVRHARDAGFPEKELQRLALQHDWEAPAPES